MLYAMRHHSEITWRRCFTSLIMTYYQSLDDAFASRSTGLSSVPMPSRVDSASTGPVQGLPKI